MQPIAKFTSILFAITASAVSVRSAVVARHDLAEVSVVFYDEVGYVGASYFPDGLVQGVCNTLPGNWLDRPESLQIGPGMTTNFKTAKDQQLPFLET